ncbi:MAG: DevR family CRISPR-associated autoregulator [Candidatus Lokiarchaeota archaeon]|nr:DevR family CRISPR-associated autoregulator [Candidatus Harpocratesius repetitus]
MSEKSKKQMIGKISYVSGTFLVQADAAFLNGAQGSPGEDQNVVRPKFMWKNGNRVPYVSSQAWKHWLRDTLIRETGWPASKLRAVGWNDKGNTSKIAGMLDPLTYPEDDLFGYMFAHSSKSELPKDATEEQKKIVESLPKEQLVRAAPFMASLLSAIQMKGTLTNDEAFVHLEGEDSPLPYTTQFYNADLSAIFGINVSRLGVFDNYRNHELNSALIDNALKSNILEIVEPKTPKKNNAIFKRTKIEEYRKKIIVGVLDSLSKLQGGAKLAQFGTDVAPKAMVFAGLTINAPILNNLFTPGKEKPRLNIDLLKELISDYKEKIETPIYIGIRKDYLENDEEVRKLKEHDDISIIVDSPLGIVSKFSDLL